MKFWKDCWIGEVLLAHVFSNLFEVASDKETWVSSQVQDNNWAITFRHHLSVVILKMLTALICTLREHIFQDTMDKIIWKAGSSASFTVRFQYQLLQPSRSQDIAMKHI